MQEKRRHLQREKREEADWERQELEAELIHTRDRLRQAYAAFDLVTDPDLIEAWTYEINAQRARYTYLLRRRKTLGLQQSAPDRDEVQT